MPSTPIRVILPGLLRDLAGVGEIEVRDPVPLTVGEVLDRAFVEHRILDGKVRDERGGIRQHVKVFVNGEDATREAGTGTAVPAGARVHIVSAVSGG